MNDLRTMYDSNSKKVLNFVTQNAIFVCLLALILFIILWDPTFLSFTVLRDILVQVSTRSIIALGAAFVLITAGCDLSAGRMVGLAAVLSGSLLQTQDYTRRFFPNMQDLPLLLPILVAIAAGLLFGLLNGFVVSRLSVPPFIATLATMTIIYGINSLYVNLPPNESQPIAGFRKDFTFLGSGYILNIPVIILIAIVVIVITWIILNKTRFGKNIYAIGGNVNAAKVSGINVRRTLMGLYAYAGGLYGLAGVLIFGVINYGLTFVGMNPYWQQIIKGIIIVVAVAFDIRKYLAKK